MEYMGQIFKNEPSKISSTNFTWSILEYVILICDALRDLVPSVKFKRSEKHSYRSDTFNKVADFSLQRY